MTIKLTPWNIQDHLNTPQEIAFYLEASFKDGDPEIIRAALGDVAKAKGMTELERDTGITRSGLYKAFGKKGDPKLSTLFKVFEALDLRMSVSISK